MENSLNSSSSWTSLKRKFAWLLKYKEFLRSGKVKDKKLTTEDMKNSEIAIFKMIQRRYFKREIELTLAKKCLPRNSKLKNLSPFLDENFLLRAGGRLKNSNLSFDQMHPIILPKHHVSNLILIEFHKGFGHMGKETTLTGVREKYWIIGANTSIKEITKNCIRCRKLEGRPCEQIMAELPEDRVKGDEPLFTNVGLDCFGPFYVIKGRKQEKRYGIIFTCLSSRAMHIEICFTMDTDAFINSLRRFIARRGQVKVIRCDNGSNFIGGKNELAKEFKTLNQDRIQNKLIGEDIQWIFNPPCSSHFGGVWEREIRSIRKVLMGLLQEQPLKFSDDTLNTLMCEVEAILNSRPLTTLSDSVDDLTPLTPNHLLHQKLNVTYPPGIFKESDIYARRKWKQVQYLADIFWKRWKLEYLHLLQTRSKWKDIRKNILVDDIVLVIDMNLPRCNWPLGKVVESFPDKSGFVRAVKIRTNSGILHRPISKVVFLFRP